MPISEIHQNFKLDYDKLDTLANPELTPENIDYLLNSAQDELIELCTKEGLESTQTISDYLSPLTKREVLNGFYTDLFSEPNAKYINLPSDYRKVLMERVKFYYPDCNLIKSGKLVPDVPHIVQGTINYGGRVVSDTVFTPSSAVLTYTGSGLVYKALEAVSKILPVSRDTYSTDIDNPFRKPYNEQILRLVGNNPGIPGGTYELVFPPNVVPVNYRLDYLRNPVQMRYGTVYSTPTTDVQCELNTEAQIKIIDIAVQNAFKALSQQTSMLQNT